LLVNPGSAHGRYQGLADRYAAKEPPHIAGLMATFLRRRNVDVAILDANAEDLGSEETAERIAEIRPVLTVLVIYGHNPTASTIVMPAARATLAALKRHAPTLTALMVGGHVAALPERTLREEPTDFVASGEGYHTIYELFRAIEAKETNLTKVRGLWYREGSALRFTEPAPLVTDLANDIPTVPWEILPMERYRAHNWHHRYIEDGRSPYAAFYTTLGCPYHCGYCPIQAPFKEGERVLKFAPGQNSYRMWPPELIVEQVELLVNQYGVTNLKIADEMFVLNPRHVLAVCDGLVNRGLGTHLNIWAYARPDTAKPRLLDQLRRAGVTWLCLGIESGSTDIRREVDKNFDQDSVYRVVEQIQNAGIEVMANYIFGLPGETQESMQATLDLALDLNCAGANFYCNVPYPGSQEWTTLDPSLKARYTDWGMMAQLSVDFLPMPGVHLSSAEILQFRDDAFRTYHLRPAFLQMVEKKFGAPARREVETLAACTLERSCTKHQPVSVGQG
jgi:radical SAM superfamily enzyme YgiQ (UPF0313 family)